MRRMGLKSACLAAKGSQSQREINRSIGFSFFRMVVLEDEEKENKRKLRYRKGQKLDPMPYCSLISNISYIFFDEEDKMKPTILDCLGESCLKRLHFPLL